MRVWLGSSWAEARRVRRVQLHGVTLLEWGLWDWPCDRGFCSVCPSSVRGSSPICGIVHPMLFLPSGAVHPIHHDLLLQKGETEFKSVNLIAKKMSAKRAGEGGGCGRGCVLGSHLSRLPEYVSSLALFWGWPSPCLLALKEDCQGKEKENQIHSFNK